MVLEERQAWLAQRGIPYLSIIPPDKQSIYPQWMPDEVPRGKGPSRLDQLIAHLTAHSTVGVVDMRHQLIEAAAAGRVYNKSDSHWNDRGAYIGYRAILAAVKQACPAKSVQPQEESAFDAVSIRGEGGDLAGMMGLKDSIHEDRMLLIGRAPAVTASGWVQRTIRAGDTFRITAATPVDADHRLLGEDGGGTNYGERIITGRDDPTLPTIVLIRDSFCNAMTPMLAEHFRRAVFCSQDDFDRTVIEAEHPDVVATEIVERKLYQPPVENPAGMLTSVHTFPPAAPAPAHGR
jgi:hypothetical protein